MKKRFFISILNVLFISCLALGQSVVLEGYVFEDNNRGFLNEVSLKVFDANTEAFIGEIFSNQEGFFTIKLTPDKDYIFKATKDLFFNKEEKISTNGKKTGEKVYAKVKMERKPGYIFDVTLAEKDGDTSVVDAIRGAKIEVYNNTKRKETLVVDKLNGINFNVTFERGNHYTVLIRKEGYFNKRLEAYVDVEGCILCFEGVGSVTPGVSDVMSRGFQMGSVLANIELEPASLNRKMRIDNIYYDLDKYYIRKDAAVELDKVIRLLNDNPRIIIELGSHTDSRGGTRYNKKLSSQRAKAAVEYIIKNGSISASRINSKGYGESELVNKCSDGVKCSKEEHQENRRTELKIIGFEELDPSIAERSLAEILTEERLLREVQNSEQVQVAPGETFPFPKEKKASKKQKEIMNVPKEASQTEQKIDKNINPNTTQIAKEIIETKSANKEQISVGNTDEKNKQNQVQIRSASSNNGETLIKQGTADVADKTKEKSMLTFNQNQVLIVENNKPSIIPKMIDNQLNTKLVDMMLGKQLMIKNQNGNKTYQFDSIEKMPLPLLNALLQKIAMLRSGDVWKIYPIEAALPKEILDALK